MKPSCRQSSALVKILLLQSSYAQPGSYLRSCFNQVGKKGERSIIDDKVLKTENATLCTHAYVTPPCCNSLDADIGNCEECDFIITGNCTKILVGAPLAVRLSLLVLIYHRVVQEVAHHVQWPRRY